MATYYATKTRWSRASDGTHEHLTGVLTGDGVFQANAKVEESIAAGDLWYTQTPGSPNARIRTISYCPAKDCFHKPYLRTDADTTTKNNLDNLPRG